MLAQCERVEDDVKLECFRKKGKSSLLAIARGNAEKRSAFRGYSDR